VVGNREVPGRPELFATTRQFLDDLGLRSLTELPTPTIWALVDIVTQGAQARASQRRRIRCPFTAELCLANAAEAGSPLLNSRAAPATPLQLSL